MQTLTLWKWGGFSGASAGGLLGHFVNAVFAGTHDFEAYQKTVDYAYGQEVLSVILGALTGACFGLLWVWWRFGRGQEGSPVRPPSGIDEAGAEEAGSWPPAPKPPA